LVATGSVTPNQLEDLDVAVQRAELDLRDARLSLRNAELDLSRTKIRAPMDGRLINFPAEVGEVASSATGVNGGSALGTIADPTKLKVVVEVGELDFGRLKLGMPVKVSTEGGRPRPGKVSFIPSSARASSDTKTIKVFPVEVVLDGETDGILPGMTVGVDFVFLEKDVAVSVPFEAIKFGKSGGKSKGSFGAKADSAKATDSVASVAAKGAGEGRDSAGAATKRGGAGKEWAGKPGATGEGRHRSSEASAGALAIKPGTVMVHDAKGELVSRTVKTGVTDYRRTEIVEGLAAGDTVWIQDDASSGKPAAAGARGPGGMH
jgi:multidrug efflux pump subunit AcrA (membrane-fusion protein)